MTRTPKLTDFHKQHIAQTIEQKAATVTEMANMYGVHPRTIYRALEELGMGTAQTDRKPSAGKQALEIMAKHGISLDQLDAVLVQASSFNRFVKQAPTKHTAALFHPAPSVAVN